MVWRLIVEQLSQLLTQQQAASASSSLELRVLHISRWALAHGSKPDASAFRLILGTPNLSGDETQGSKSEIAHGVRLLHKRIHLVIPSLVRMLRTAEGLVNCRHPVHRISHPTMLRSLRRSTFALASNHFDRWWNRRCNNRSSPLHGPSV